MDRQKYPVWAESWFKQIIKNSKFDVHSIPLTNSKDWKYDHGVIAHKSDLFFKIVGVTWKDQSNKEQNFPLIEQREIGTLGFMLKKHKTQNKILVQAKIEPGNVGICQIAPTYQATASNAARVHGGKTPFYRKYFLINSEHNIFQTLQSEHGSRFLGKMNRNISIFVKKEIKPTVLHKWISVNQLLECLDSDYVINTDARSVLLCTPWDILVGRPSFTRYDNSISKHLNNSYNQVNNQKLIKIQKKIEKERLRIHDPQTIDLNNLKGWVTNPEGRPTINNKAYSIKQISVTAYGREVTNWDQPIIDSKSEGQIYLFCSIIGKVMQFYVVPRAEAGLVHKVELGPSVSINPGDKQKYLPPKNFKALAQVKQSDEGGRFLRDITSYELLQIQNHKEVNIPGGYWLTLGEVSKLLQKDGIINNEARSAFSLVLKWL